jgi:DNA-binding CsgD family transcriptional regulator
MPHSNGWPTLFSSAFSQSRNGMLLVDERRRVVDANPAFLRLVGRGREGLVGNPVWELVIDGPLASEREWRDYLGMRRFDGEATLHAADRSGVAVQWGATATVVAGRQLVLFVTLSTSRSGARFRRAAVADGPSRALSPREREVVRLVAEGATGKEIADELHISHETVRTHVRNAMIKVGARSRAHLVAKALGADLSMP